MQSGMELALAALLHGSSSLAQLLSSQQCVVTPATATPSAALSAGCVPSLRRAMSSLAARLLHEMWTGRVPVHFSLAPNEVTGLESPLPYVLLLPRHSYLPLCIDPVRRHLLPSAPAVEDELWLEVRDSACPWRWQLPIGVLADIEAAKQLAASAAQPHSVQPSTLHSSLDLPLRLTVHFQSFPARRLLRCRSVQTVRHHFMHTLKEATFIRRGDSKSVSAAAISQHNKLWDSLLGGHEDVYAQTMAALAGAGGAASAGSSGGGQQQLKSHLPVRVFLVGFLSDERGLLEREREAGGSEMADMHYSPMQRPVLASEQTTVGDVLSELLGDGEGAAGVLQSGELQSVAVLAQGLAVELDTPVEWLYRHCAHPDAFLYLTAIRLRAETLR